MTFLQPAVLFALPIAALPLIIHLIHLYRRRQVKWAAMIFLRAAQQMHKGLSRLRQILILTLRILAVAALLLMAGRPLAGGWLGLTGGAPDTVLVLLDRSASMEQINVATGVSKREAGLRNLAKAINDTVGSRSHLVLIDSAPGKPIPLDKADALLDLPQTEATDTAADIPALMQAALDYITTNKADRTDVWLLSDLQQSNWDPSSGRWQTLRGAFATLQGVRFHLLAYPQAPGEDMGIGIDRVTRHETSEKAELLLDLRIVRHGAGPAPPDVPVRFVVNGTATAAKAALQGNATLIQGYSIPIDKATKRGWGLAELPADGWAADNVFYFVFDEPPPLRSVIVSDDEGEAGPLKAALAAAADPERKYIADILPARRAAEIPWAETALLVWQAPLPKKGEPLAAQLRDFVAAGRTLLFLPPPSPDATEMFGLHWGSWQTAAKADTVQWWRNDADLLANTRNGAALPVGAVQVTRFCPVEGEGSPLARMAGNEELLVRSSEVSTGAVYFLGTLPAPGSSSLARDGVVLFALLQRALDEGAGTLGKARQGVCAAGALGADPSQWHSVDRKGAAILATLPLRAGVLAAGDRLLALNRPPGEDLPQTLSTGAINELFAGLDFRLVTDTLESGRSLTNEVWRTFLAAMALAILGEALLCMPPRRQRAAFKAGMPAVAASV